MPIPLNVCAKMQSYHTTACELFLPVFLFLCSRISCMRLFSINECGTLALLILCVFRNTVEAWYIAPPRINSEWEQLAGLVVDCFEAPPCEAVATDRIAWRLFQRTLSKKQTYRQFVRTARKMKGKKYSILIAKEGSRVIGMVELGINVNAIISENYNNTVTESANRRATIGVVCVEEQYQRMGIASALIKSCKLIVADQWQESVLYAEVEFTNAKALEFFELAGFTPLPPDWGGQQVVMVQVRRRNKVEYVPHLLLAKTLS